MRSYLLFFSDATPLRNLQLHKLICVPNNMSLLTILDRFQEGRSHMAIVSRFSEEKAASVKHHVKKGLTQRLKERVGISDSSGSDTESDSDSSDDENATEVNGDGSASGSVKKGWRKSFKRKRNHRDVEKGGEEPCETETATEKEPSGPSTPLTTWAKLMAPGREQSMPDDAVLPKDNAKEVGVGHATLLSLRADELCVSFCPVLIQQSPHWVSSHWRMS